MIRFGILPETGDERQQVVAETALRLSSPAGRAIRPEQIHSAIHTIIHPTIYPLEHRT